MENLWTKNLRKIDPYVPGEQSSDRDIVKLNANENPYPPSPMAVQAHCGFIQMPMLRRLRERLPIIITSG